MKMSKLEKIWLGLSLLFLVLFYFPGLPPYLDSKGLLIHGALTLIPFFLVSTIGNSLVNKRYKLKKEDTDSKEGENS